MIDKKEANITKYFRKKYKNKTIKKDPIRYKIYTNKYKLNNTEGVYANPQLLLRGGQYKILQIDDLPVQPIRRINTGSLAIYIKYSKMIQVGIFQTKEYHLFTS